LIQFKALSFNNTLRIFYISSLKTGVLKMKRMIKAGKPSIPSSAKRTGMITPLKRKFE